MTTSLGRSVDDPLLQLCAQLRAQQLHADIAVTMVCGEPDVRLQVCQDGRPDLAVELLAPDPPTRRPRHWDAVRIQWDGRQVWRGPDGGCSLEEVREFVQALLCLGATQLAQLYLDLG